MITIHIGLLKTASTSLQDTFASDPRLAYISYQEVEPLRRAAHEAAAAGVPLPDQVPVGVLVSLLKAVADRPTVISDERFSGIPYYHYVDKSAEVTRAFQVNCARLLQAVAPDARIMVVLREPAAWLVSYYKQFLKFGEPRPIKRYARDLRGHLVQSYNVDFMVDLYGGLFGHDKVHVLPFEMLRKNAAGFMGQVSDIVGVPLEMNRSSNQGLDDRLAEPLRQLSTVLGYLARKKRWSDQYARQIRLMLFDVVEGALKDQPHHQEVLIRALNPGKADFEPPEDVVAEMRQVVARTVSTNPLFAPYRSLYGV